MFNPNRAIYAVLNRWFPETAWRFVPRAPNHLQLTPQQLQVMEDAGIYRIKLEYRPNVRCVIQRSYWTSWESDAFLAPELRSLPRDVLLIARNASGVVEVHAGPSYESLSAEQFETVVAQLLKTAQESIEYTDFLRRRARQGC